MYITGITPTQVDSSAGFSLGTLGGEVTANGIKIWVYGKGVASCILGSFCVFDEAWQAALTVHASYGLVGAAGGAIVASKFGWFQVYGYCAAGCSVATLADNAAVYTHATVGYLYSTAASMTHISGATPRELVGGANATAVYSLAWPTASAYGAAAA